MKKKGRAALWVLASLTLCTGLTVLLGILLLPAVIGRAPDRVGEEISGIDYYPDLPENCALLALGEEGEGALIYLDFADISVRVYPFAANAAEGAEALGYKIGYTMEISDRFLCRLCDRLGGVDMSVSGKTERFSSASLAPLLEKRPTEEEMLKISSAFFEKIAKTGLSSGDFMFIIEGVRTDLNYPVCYDWIGYLPELFSNCIFQ